MENQSKLGSILLRCNNNNKKKKLMSSGGDFISQLPDEILEDILSRLTMKEAGRTSVVSRRWQHLWEFRTGSMDFDFGWQLLEKRIYMHSKFNILGKERAKYISRVNNIISRHRGQTIEEFRVEFGIRDQSVIDSWIKFALNKRVQRLELHFQTVHAPRDTGSNEFYLFPVCYDVSCLKSLILDYVNVTGEVFEYLLLNCHLLEYLDIKFSKKLVKSTVVAPCSKLKHLSLAYCLYLEEITIYSAPNLTTFFCDTDVRLHFRDVPKLSHMSLQGSYCVSMIGRFRDLPISLSQLQKLTLSIPADELPKFRSSFPELMNLKELELIWEIHVDRQSLLWCTAVLEACPNLNKLLMEFQWWTTDAENRDVGSPPGSAIVHNNLKELELVCFQGEATDVELVAYILRNSPNIDKIKVSTRRTYVVDTWIPPEDNAFAKEFVTFLTQELSPKAQLLLL